MIGIAVGQWFARYIIANEVHGCEPLPELIRPFIALAMLDLGWPDIETAQATLDEWEWA